MVKRTSSASKNLDQIFFTYIDIAKNALGTKSKAFFALYIYGDEL